MDFKKNRIFHENTVDILQNMCFVEAMRVYSRPKF